MSGVKWNGTYFQSWSSAWTSNGAKLDLALLPTQLNLVYIAFVDPKCAYVSGQKSFVGTGVQFSCDFDVVRVAVGLLVARGTRVLLSVGGSTYGFTGFNPQGVAALCVDLGCSGVDLDWEPIDGAKSAGLLGGIISGMRGALPRPMVLGMAGFSVGAYGELKWAKSLPSSIYTGMNIPGLESNGSDLDMVGVMAYDADVLYNPVEAVSAFRQYFLGDIVVGCEVGKQAWGNAIMTLGAIPALITACQGLFTWSWQKAGSPSAFDVMNAAVPVTIGVAPVLNDTMTSFDLRLTEVESKVGIVLNLLYDLRHVIDTFK